MKEKDVKSKGCRQKSQGQALTELALILPILVLVGSVGVDLARMVLTAHRVAAAVHEGARYTTESPLPLTLPLQDCSLNTPSSTVECGSGTVTTCCIAISRANLALFDSGVTNHSVQGQWIQQEIMGRQYAFLRITMSSNVNFFFSIGNQMITSSAVGFADEMPEGEEN